MRKIAANRNYRLVKKAVDSPSLESYRSLVDTDDEVRGTKDTMVGGSKIIDDPSGITTNLWPKVRAALKSIEEITTDPFYTKMIQIYPNDTTAKYIKAAYTAIQSADKAFDGRS